MPSPRREHPARAQACPQAALPCLLAALFAGGCSGDRAAAAPQGPPRPLAQSFDFGTIQHGKAGEHDFVLDARKELGPGYYPVGTNIDCSCARALLLLRAADGKERVVGPPGAAQAPREGEVVVVRMQVDTARKEPVDLGPVDSRAMVQFQDRDAPSGAERVLWQLTFRFAVDSPVRVRPFAILDFERVPISKTGSLLTSLCSDLPDRPIRFGPAHCDEPRLHLELEQKGDQTWLRAELRPQPGDGGMHIRTLVTIDTDLDTGYQVKLAAIAEITPDLVALPIAKISLRADLRKAQTAERAQSQYLLVTDHDERRPAEFRVARLVDAAGNDASKLFEVTFEEVRGDPRSRRVRLRWVGHAESEFRGELVLAKDVQAGPFLPIEVVALHSPQP